MSDIILGAGILGLTCAHYLADAARKVRVIEARSSIFENKCSWFAGGMIAPWCELAAVLPTQKADMLVMGQVALAYWRKFIPSFQDKGTLVVAHLRDAQDLQHFAAKTSGYHICNDTEISVLEPDLAGRFQHGLFFDKEAHLDPRDCLKSLYQQASCGGVVFDFDHCVSEKEFTQLQADRPGRVIDCRGLSARQALSDHCHLSLRGIRGEMMVIHAPEVNLSRPVRFLHPRIPLYIVPRDHQRYMIGATMIEEEDQARRKMSVRAALELLSAAYTLHPGFGEAHIEEMSVGWRPAFADNHPRLVWREQKAYLGLNGAYRHGFLAAPSLAADCLAFLTRQEAYKRNDNNLC